MKNFCALSVMLIAPAAFATTGINCKSIDGTLEVYTEEAIAEGDNVITLGVIAPWLQKESFSFSKLNSKDEVNVTREEGTVYMANNVAGQSITLVLDSAVRGGSKLSTVYLKHSGKIYVETVACSGADSE